MQMNLCATVTTMKNMKNLKILTATINSYSPISYTSEAQIYAVHLPEGSCWEW